MNATTDLGRLQLRLMERLTYAGLTLVALGVALSLLAGFIDLAVVFEASGGGAVGAFAVAGGMVLLPLTYSLAPLYAGLTWGDWMPLLFSGAGSVLLVLVGRLVPPAATPGNR